MDEPFLMTYIQPLRRRMREQAVVNVIKPFRKVSFEYVSKELLLTNEEVENIIITLILDEKIKASIDQINQCIVFKEKSTDGDSGLYKLVHLESIVRKMRNITNAQNRPSL